MSILQAIILGILQGFTEFLPISSSGHLELGQALLGVQTENELLFSLMLHVATVLSTIIVFREDILKLVKALLQPKWNAGKSYILMLAVSMVPVGLIGFLAKDQIEVFFEGNILLVGCMLMVTAFLLWLSTYEPAKKRPLNIPKALLIGVAQMMAVIPGISRSGATISVGLLLGLERREAARFSFLMVLAPILGAGLLEVRDLGSDGLRTFEMSYIFGFAAALISGVLACRWMIRLVERSRIAYFAIYCLIIGFAAVFFSYGAA